MSINPINRPKKLMYLKRLTDCELSINLQKNVGALQKRPDPERSARSNVGWFVLPSVWWILTFILTADFKTLSSIPLGLNLICNKVIKSKWPSTHTRTHTHTHARTHTPKESIDGELSVWSRVVRLFLCISKEDRRAFVFQNVTFYKEKDLVLHTRTEIHSIQTNTETYVNEANKISYYIWAWPNPVTSTSLPQPS